ncbi:hypothetical protein BDZ89DRAFT_1102188 [Hymenopellis radicata]|nr:hypothetical protein BDZ89DRAFT_1102188 [Hymenopellis radicata]
MSHSSSRPITPDSPLTTALANFSRVPSPEPPSLLTCCCDRENCENMTAWLDMKSRLESRLILSAEVGQALLQRHEQYVRRQKRRQRSEALDYDDELSPQEEMERRLGELGRERDALEKRLTQALVNNEVTEVSNKTILQELQETKTTVSRLTAHHARSVGWETRMSAAMKERDDMQQERDFESHRARVAESRFAALKDKTSRLQADVRRLQDDLAEKRMHRLESSESILQDARSQLEVLQRSLSPSVASEQTELTKVLESLMDDNEVLKRDTAELQHFLAESREEIHALQEEVEEYRANAPPRSGARTPTFRQHFHSGSMPSSVLKEQMTGNSGRGSSRERKFRKPYDLLTPESHVRPLSPAESDSKWTSFNPIQPHPRRPISPYQFEVADDADQDLPVEFTKGNKPLLLLSRSRGVQTDPVSDRGLLSASPSSFDPRSDSSSYSESASNMAQLIERVASLLNRLQQADAFTLTSRLKRQHLRGADVAHLSRSTINNVLSEAAALRVHFRALLEDEKLVTPCNRRDLRALLKLFRDIFSEMGQMRVTLNEIILDPSIAPKVSELALDPSKSDVLVGKERDAENNGAAAGWMAPISKLFGATSVRPESGVGGERGLPALTRSVSAKVPARPARFVPKLGPALSASATTVNVEFSGAGVGRAVTSTFSAHPSRPGPSAPQASTAQGVMGIFAGAPRSSTPDPWVVVPNSKGPRRVQSTMQTAESPGLRRTHAAARSANRMSRNVDALLEIQQTPTREDQESEEPDYLGPLLEHRLRRRGLSDSSIHSTFMAQAAEDSGAAGDADLTPRRETAWPDRGSVLQALSRTVQNFRLGGSSDVGVLCCVEQGTGGQGFRCYADTWPLALDCCDGMSDPPPDSFFGSPTRLDESGFLERTQRGDFY